jgi:hypothetical protein
MGSVDCETTLSPVRIPRSDRPPLNSSIMHLSLSLPS